MTDQQQDLVNLTARLDRTEQALERAQGRSRRDRRLVAGGLGLGAALLLMGQSAPPQKAVLAESFVLVGADGKVRGGMGTSKGGGSVFLTDSNNKKRIHMTVSKKGTPAINMLDPEGKVRLSLGVANDGLCFIAQKGPKGKIRNFMFTDANGNPNIRLKDGEGKNITTLPKKSKKKKKK